MGLARVLSRACAGVCAPGVVVETHLSGGLPRVAIVGMPRKAVTEARDRVRAALMNCGFDYPARNITVSLAPAELPKDGGCFDLPIALGIIAASRQCRSKRLKGTEFLGELSLAGELQAVRGILPAALRARAAGHRLVVPLANSAEAALLAQGPIFCARSLSEVVAWLNGEDVLAVPEADAATRPARAPDLKEVIGQQLPRRALELCAAGGHNLLMCGPPGTGKTMLAARLPGLLPPMTEAEALESAAIASVSHGGFSPDQWRQRPFRAPHHTASAIALVGGGQSPQPGEISLAHQGVLFLDELPEFPRRVLDSLREPLEAGTITISRASAQADFPAVFQLVCAMNPCPCGYAGDPAANCRCSHEQVQRYAARISGPLMDRIDLQVQVLRPDPALLHATTMNGEDSATVRQRVGVARAQQLQRQSVTNARLSSNALRQHCGLKAKEQKLLTRAARQLQLSPRACHSIMRVARTIADLDGREQIALEHLSEAIGLRRPVQAKAP
ncbi:MAG: YifB family Mg chelatase-like AAA ATPase [Xanthomonadales bacterium]|nr:YifB family Mg chelatase-like AAA ATPase [Xanthomonadales bacterium]